MWQEKKKKNLLYPYPWKAKEVGTLMLQGAHKQ